LFGKILLRNDPSVMEPAADQQMGGWSDGEIVWCFVWTQEHRFEKPTEKEKLIGTRKANNTSAKRQGWQHSGRLKYISNTSSSSSRCCSRPGVLPIFQACPGLRSPCPRERNVCIA